MRIESVLAHRMAIHAAFTILDFRNTGERRMRPSQNTQFIGRVASGTGTDPAVLKGQFAGIDELSAVRAGKNDQ